MAPPISLRLGERVLQGELGRRGGVRWAVGRLDGPRSSTWRLWGNKKGDFYLSARSLGASVKTSLHADGRCHSGLTQSYFERLRALGRAPASRHADRWTLPAEPVSKVVQIAVPESELRRFDSSEDPQTGWLPAPGPGHVNVSTLFVTPKGPEPTSWPGEAHGASLVAVAVSGNRIGWLVSKNHEITAEMAEEFERYRSELSARPMAPPAVGARAMLFGSRGNGERFYVEFAWDGEVRPFAA